jgi:hypothetical protein
MVKHKITRKSGIRASRAWRDWCADGGGDAKRGGPEPGGRSGHEPWDHKQDHMLTAPSGRTSCAAAGEETAVNDAYLLVCYCKAATGKIEEISVC